MMMDGAHGSYYMLEGLDAINWRRIMGAYGLGAKLPQRIRELLSPDETIRKQALHDVAEEIAHQDSIYPATPVVVPFLIEIVASPNVPGRASVMDLLLYVAHNVRSEAVLGGLYESGLTLDTAETLLNLRGGHNIFLELLTHSDARIRQMAALLVAETYLHPPRTRILLRRHLAREQNPYVKASLIFALSRSFSFSDERWWLNLERCISKVYADYLLQFIKPEHDAIVRNTTAIAWLYSNSFHALEVDEAQEVPLETIETLVTLLSTGIRGFYPNDAAHLINRAVFYFTWKTVFDFTVKPLGALEQLLRASNLAPWPAHMIGRELVDIALRFQRRPDTATYHYGDPWRPFMKPQARMDDPDMIYAMSVTPQPASPQAPRLMLDDKMLMRLVLDSAPFWQLPTNLFSFFYGLPDDREQLRAWLDAHTGG